MKTIFAHVSFENGNLEYEIMNENKISLTKEKFEKIQVLSKYILAKRKKNQDWNLLDLNGNFIFEEDFYDIYVVDEENDLFAVMKNKDEGYYLFDVKKREKIFQNPYWRFIKGFRDGWIAVSDENGKCFFLNKEERKFLDREFDWIHPFENGLSVAWVGSYDDAIYYVLSAKGEKISEPFVFANLQKDGTTSVGLALVFNENDECAFIDENLELTTSTWFERAKDYRNGFAVVIIRRNEMNYINEKGELLSKENFRHCEDFDEGGTAIITKKDRGMNLINAKGNFILQEDVFNIQKIYSASMRSYYYSVIGKDGKSFYVSSWGKAYQKLSEMESDAKLIDGLKNLI